jgi:hypothetical protein
VEDYCNYRVCSRCVLHFELLLRLSGENSCGTRRIERESDGGNFEDMSVGWSLPRRLNRGRAIIGMASEWLWIVGVTSCRTLSIESMITVLKQKFHSNLVANRLITTPLRFKCWFELWRWRNLKFEGRFWKCFLRSFRLWCFQQFVLRTSKKWFFLGFFEIRKLILSSLSSVYAFAGFQIHDFDFKSFFNTNRVKVYCLSLRNSRGHLVNFKR